MTRKARSGACPEHLEGRTSGDGDMTDGARASAQQALDPLTELAARRGATLPTRRFGTATPCAVPPDGPSVTELLFEQRHGR